MSDLVRTSVSLESELLQQIDRLCAAGRFASRSDAFRHAFREALTASAWNVETCRAFAVVTLVCSCSCASLARRMTEIQREELDLIVSTTRVLVDPDTSLEVIIMHGRPRRLEDLATRLCGLKGVRAGKTVLATTQRDPGDETIAHVPGRDDERPDFPAGR